MNKILLAVALIAGTATSAFAASDIQGKVMGDLLGANQRGATANPTAQPQSGSLTDKAMQDTPGVTGPGRTVTPTAKPYSGSLSDKAMRDQLGS